MSTALREWFGIDLSGSEPLPVTTECPFVGGECTKKYSDGTANGACSLQTAKFPFIPICPNRMYERDYFILQDAAEFVFGLPLPLYTKDSLPLRAQRPSTYALALGKGSYGEIPLPRRKGSRTAGNYYVDWILCHIENDNVVEFTAAEVQTIDTTGSYRDVVSALRGGTRVQRTGRGFGLNWENVNKRILPQLVYKGHLFHREERNRKGMLFLCPDAVLKRLLDRLGPSLNTGFAPQPGSITLMGYKGDSKNLNLVRATTVTTTVHDLGLALTSPRDLPEPGAYAAAIDAQLRQVL